MYIIVLLPNIKLTYDKIDLIGAIYRELVLFLR